jgi:integrase
MSVDIRRRSPNTVNTLMGAVMAFLRFCGSRGSIASVPELEKVDAEEVMKGRPVTEAEFQRMLDATPACRRQGFRRVLDFRLKVLWESGFRVGEMMDFSWDDSRFIHPVWPKRLEQLPHNHHRFFNRRTGRVQVQYVTERSTLRIAFRSSQAPRHRLDLIFR